MPPVQGYPINSPAPVQGFPVASAVGSSGATGAQGQLIPASMAVATPVQRLPAGTDLLRSGTPQVRAAAMVGASNLITVQEIMEQVNLRHREYDTLPLLEREAKQKEIYREELRRTIERELLIDDMFTQMKKHKASTDDIKEDVAKMVDERIRSIRKSQGLRTEDELAKLLAYEGATLGGFKRSMERQIPSDRYVSAMMKEFGKSRAPGSPRCGGITTGTPTISRYRTRYATRTSMSDSPDTRGRRTPKPRRAGMAGCRRRGRFRFADQGRGRGREGATELGRHRDHAGRCAAGSGPDGVRAQARGDQSAVRDPPPATTW